MSSYTPIIVAAPVAARKRLQKLSFLPSRIFRDILTEPMWENQTAPSVYMWPYDIPYQESSKWREDIVDHMGDVPAFFGMADCKGSDHPDLEKDHQERILSRMLFNSVVVHIFFLDDGKSERIRNESYAKMRSFSDIVTWGNDLKTVMDVRFLNHRSKSAHVLVIVANSKQVKTTKAELEAFAKCLGQSTEDDYKPFCACYFLDEHLANDGAGHLFHSKYVWDVMVNRLLMTMILSQEKSHGDNPHADPVAIWKREGIRVWRASDCVFTVDAVGEQQILNEALEKAEKALQEFVGEDDQSSRMVLLNDPVEKRMQFPELKPSWQNGRVKDVCERPAQDKSVGIFKRTFYDWADLPTDDCEKELNARGHWKKSFDTVMQGRQNWCAENPPADYTESVNHFFSTVKRKPGEINVFVSGLAASMDNSRKKLDEDGYELWSQAAAAENSRQQVLKEAGENGKELQKAQRYYVGAGFGSFIVFAVTLFIGWIILKLLWPFNIDYKFMIIFALSFLVLLGAAAAYVTVLILHNLAGSRAADRLIEEYKAADKAMITRDEKIREMFRSGINIRDLLSLQNVRFRTWLLANRTLSILLQELSPRLSSVESEADAKEEDESEDDLKDRDGVRDAFLRTTRAQIGPVEISARDFSVDPAINDFFKKDREDAGSFLCLWEKKLCSEDMQSAGYHPCKLFISQIRDFVSRFLGRIESDINAFVIEKSGEDGNRKKPAEIIESVRLGADDVDLMSAALLEIGGRKKNTYVFVNPLLKVDHKGNELLYYSDLLGGTKIAALFFQEYLVEFKVKPIAGSEDQESGQLDFEAISNQ